MAVLFLSVFCVHAAYAPRSPVLVGKARTTPALPADANAGKFRRVSLTGTAYHRRPERRREALAAEAARLHAAAPGGRRFRSGGGRREHSSAVLVPPVSNAVAGAAPADVASRPRRSLPALISVESGDPSFPCSPLQ
mgnify:CR=1 FL=1